MNDLRQYNDVEVKEIIENEGLEYAITGYIGSESIKNIELAKLWDDARRALKAIEDYLHLDE